MTLSRFPARCVGSDGAWPSKGTCLRSEAAPALLAAPRASVRVRPFLCLSCQSVALLMLCKFFCSPLQRLMKPSSTIWGGGGVTDLLAVVHLEESLRRVLVGLVAHNIFSKTLGGGGPTRNPFSVSAARTHGLLAVTRLVTALCSFFSEEEPFWLSLGRAQCPHLLSAGVELDRCFP